jgi:hypothetical protein
MRASAIVFQRTEVQQKLTQKVQQLSKHVAFTLGGCYAAKNSRSPDACILDRLPAAVGSSGVLVAARFAFPVGGAKNIVGD